MALTCLKKKIQFDLFKANVRFKHLKKFKIFKFKMKRRRFRRLKHKTNFFLLHNVFKFWIIDFYLSKRLCKFEYMFNSAKTTFLVYNFNYLNSDKFNFGNAPFSIYSLAKTSYTRIVDQFFFFKTFLALKHHTLSFVSTNETYTFFDFSSIKASPQIPILEYDRHQLFSVTSTNTLFSLENLNSLWFWLILFYHSKYNLILISHLFHKCLH